MSGRINLSNLSDSLKEHLNSLGLTEEQVNELIEEALVSINEKDIEQDEVVNGLVDKVGELNGLMTTEKGDLVGAINELFQDVDNGKQLIADAIDDESITKDSTFEAMSESVTSLNTQIDNLLTELAGKVTPTGNAVAEDVLEGKTFINNSGEVVTGVIVNRGGSQTVTPGTSNKTLDAGYYSNNITVAGDANLKAVNIKNGVQLFGVTGTYKGDLSVVAGTRYTASSATNSNPAQANANPSVQCTAHAAGTYTVTVSGGTDDSGTTYAYLKLDVNGSQTNTFSFTCKPQQTSTWTTNITVPAGAVVKATQTSGVWLYRGISISLKFDLSF